MIATATVSHSPFFDRQSSTDRSGGGGGGIAQRSVIYGSDAEGGGHESGSGTLRGSSASQSQEASVVEPQSQFGGQRGTMNGSNEQHTVTPSNLYVRALYNYVTEDPTSLSFNEGDVIQVLGQLGSGWWDGIVNNERGWFPSNYCQLIRPGELTNGTSHSPVDDSDELDDDSYDEYDDEDEDSEHDGLASPVLPLEGTDLKENEEAAFWIPQATPEGRLYYFNTITGDSRSELPLEAPSSTNETGPRDRMHVAVPDYTRPPAEMARGYEKDHLSDARDHDEDSTSERDGETRGPSAKKYDYRDSDTTLVNSAASTDSRLFRPGHSSSYSVSTNATVVNANIGSDAQSGGTVSYYDEGTPVPLTWDELKERINLAVERYRQAINNYDRAQYVRRAEDISDMLRLLITAGSQTTDNHSGQPSIISSNRALNPHFRHFMAAFSKLVLSSHVAAADGRPPDSEAKCLAEADEVMVGVYGYAETAKAQQGAEQLPRLKPGFVKGSHAAAGWQSSPAALVTSPRSPMSAEPVADPTSYVLDSALAEKMEDLNNTIKPAMRRLEAALAHNDPFVTAHQQANVALLVMSAVQAAFDAMKKYFYLIDNIQMPPLTQASQSPTLIDFVTQKQRLYDSFADLFLACQYVSAPLADEWTGSGGEPFEERLNAVRSYIREVESGVRSLNFSTQLLVGEQESRVTEDSTITTTVWPKVDASQGRHSRNKSQTTNSTRPNPTGRVSQSQPNKADRVLGEQVNLIPQETPKFLLCDHDHEILYGAKKQVKGGTLTALVERLTRHDVLDSNFNSTFLLTYPSFTTGLELFNQLVTRFTIQPPPSLSQPEFKDWTEKKQRLIRMRVLSILKMWLEQYWMEPPGDKSKELLRKMYTFAKDVMLPQLIGTNQVLSLIEQRLRGQEPENKRLILTHASQPPPPILPRSMKKLRFLDIDPTEFARQFTILEAKSYAKIRPIECLAKGWSKPHTGQGPDLAEHIRAIITQSNQLTNWIAEVILSQQEPRRRVMVIKHVVTIADKCRQLNNFSTLTAILAALQTSAIHRLRRTWDNVPQRTQTVLGGMNSLMGASMNFALYREKLHVVNPPCVPFLGVYLKDLTFVADGNDDFIKDKDLINFGKRVKTATILREIQQYQAVPYPLQAVPELQEFIFTHMVKAPGVNEMYNLSLALEPKEREEDKIARLLQESGFL